MNKIIGLLIMLSPVVYVFTFGGDVAQQVALIVLGTTAFVVGLSMLSEDDKEE